MGTKTALQLAQTFCRKKGLAVPAALVASTDAGILQIWEVMNAVGRDLTARKQGPFLKQRKTWALVATEDQGSILTLFGVEPVSFSVDSFYNNTLRLPIYGPMSDADYQQTKAMVPSGPFQKYIIYNGHLYITGTLVAGHTLAMIYSSKAWVESGANTGVFTAEITADTQVPVFDDEMFFLGMEWMYRREKGLDYTSQLADYRTKLMDSKGDPAPVLLGHQNSTDPWPKPGIIVPPGNWG